MTSINSYIICTSPRSGSTLLCKLLSNAENAGFPDSHFHAPSLDKWLGYYGLRNDAFGTTHDALRAVFRAALERGRGTCDIFGLRLQRHSFDYFMEQLSVLYPSLPSEKSRISAAFGSTLFVHLTRENKLDQAISYVKAKQSGLWHMAADGSELERLSEPKEPVYDATAIAAQLELFSQMDAEWEEWFDRERIEPLRVTYDQLAADPYATLVRVQRALGVDSAARAEVTPPTAKLADMINQKWAERFRSETQS